MAECSLDRIDLLKIDVEGAELEAMQGLTDAELACVRQLVLEVEPYHKGLVPALMDRLRRCGFTLLTLRGPTGARNVLDDPYPCTLYAVRS
jgi:hypothetical protein